MADLISTVLDLLGLLLIVAGAAVAVAWAVGALWSGLLVAGVGALGVSWLLVRLERGRR